MKMPFMPLFESSFLFFMEPAYCAFAQYGMAAAAIAKRYAAALFYDSCPARPYRLQRTFGKTALQPIGRAASRIWPLAK